MQLIITSVLGLSLFWFLSLSLFSITNFLCGFVDTLFDLDERTTNKLKKKKKISSMRLYLIVSVCLSYTLWGFSLRSKGGVIKIFKMQKGNM